MQLPTNGTFGVDASGFDRSHASKHYTKRTELTIRHLKVTLLVDTKENATPYLHTSETGENRWPDRSVFDQAKSESIDILLGEKGDDDQKIRQLVHQYEVRPLIKHREFTSLHKVWNARLDADLYDNGVNRRQST